MEDTVWIFNFALVTSSRFSNIREEFSESRMATTNSALWGIHAGRTGDADRLFLTQNVIALGWMDVGDLSKLPAHREAFKARVRECYPDHKEGYFPVVAGQLFRFVHEVKIGDYVVYRSKQDRNVHIGEIIGPFVYDPETDPRYPQHRTVKWLKSFPRTQFSQGALYEIGAALSLFRVCRFAEEFLTALTGLSIPEFSENRASYPEH